MAYERRFSGFRVFRQSQQKRAAGGGPAALCSSAAKSEVAGSATPAAPNARRPNELSDYRWEIEIYCDESPQLDYRDWPDDRQEGPDDWLTGTGLLLGAQRLPLRVQSPDELIGRDYWFPPPDDDPAEWSNDPCWPYFFLYVWEGYPTGPICVYLSHCV